jgi:hypothetical protein
MFGVAVAMAALGIALTILPVGAGRLFRLLVYGRRYPGTFTGEAIDYLRFVYAVLGATRAGWAMLMALILFGPFRRRERWSWWALAVSFIVWFVADTAASLAAGFPENALLNTVIAVAFVPGLALTYQEMDEATLRP